MPTLKAVVLEHRGGMQFDSSPSSGHPYRFDDRDSNQGGSPVETILASLGSCSAMDVVSIAGKQRQDIDSYRVDVRGSQRDEYPQVYTEITVTHEIIGQDVSEVGIRRCIELSATKYCPVNAMISAGATVVHHRYHIVSTGETPYESEAEVVTTGPYARPDILADQT
ncbi:MAG: OsmC family protein [Chloroflexota bacterium]